jgi:hypothetical protein
VDSLKVIQVGQPYLTEIIKVRWMVRVLRVLFVCMLNMLRYIDRLRSCMHMQPITCMEPIDSQKMV